MKSSWWQASPNSPSTMEISLNFASSSFRLVNGAAGATATLHAGLLILGPRSPPLFPQLPQAYQPIQACAACSHGLLYKLAAHLRRSRRCTGRHSGLRLAHGAFVLTCPFELVVLCRHVALHGNLFVLRSRHAVIDEHALRFKDEACPERSPAARVCQPDSDGSVKACNGIDDLWHEQAVHLSAETLGICLCQLPPRKKEILREKAPELLELNLRVALVVGARHRNAELEQRRTSKFRHLSIGII